MNLADYIAKTYYGGHCKFTDAREVVRHASGLGLAVSSLFMCTFALLVIGVWRG